jgi:DNA-binding transcriptional LysR family regulator
VAFDLRQLRYFVAVAREGSLTRAAATIPVAQQSLSAQIRSLERQVGAPLLGRLPRFLAGRAALRPVSCQGGEQR